MYGYEIYDINFMCATAKDIKERYKEEEDLVMDYPWRNGVLVEMSGDPKIS